MSTSAHIAGMRPEHAEQILKTYQFGIDTGHATFETGAPTWAEFDASRLPEHRFVALDHADDVVGRTAVSPVSDRCAYAGVVEHSVYVHPDARGQGIGLALPRALLASTDAAGIWTVQSGVFPENTTSLALHHRAGFRTVGTRERLGRLHGTWRDVVLIERRSPAVS
ncbi:MULTISPECIES: GNAT family N-acetyltransferase [unclassified Streptomyces]|uniref:GNAT family N-acetyltransferase n=1 Tax=unclassified Streptomyces TaxID=2593676 RepID=UPI0006AED60D|nr:MULTISPECIES: GNAT family N-acetyltransferase [unclassified Streptomyces]KOX34277.1 phosphinothricin acetyltransferase [Streptomyces sp. NRRL F-6491]KOX42311.1 phosphinothricin acetyltransferase [Streptomyces sp. NRRL F-6492]